MLACDKFLFLHLHKSGGTFVNQLMITCLPGVRKLGYHLPASEIPAELRNLPVLGTVRNPLAYYVSWYHFQHGLPPSRRNALFKVCSEGGRLDFQATVERLATLERRPELVDALARAFPDHFVGSGLNLTKSCIARIAGSGKGFYSFLHDRMYGDVPEATILRAEELRAALHGYLAKVYPQLTRWREFLDHAPDMNRSSHGAIDDYYPQALRRLIAEMDRPVFEAYGYAGGEAAGSAAS